MVTSRSSLILPALRCRMGDWIYYLTAMHMRDIAARITPISDIHTNNSLNNLLQREITNRKKPIANYLRQQPQRFFNSIVVGVYGGSPQWTDVALTADQLATPEDTVMTSIESLNGTLGVLHLSGQELLYAIDGQHRVEGIREALKSVGELATEQVGVIFVAHSKSPEGVVRSRRLFSTLNRYAKPVSPGEIVALDEDDAFAIVTRRLLALCGNIT